VCICMQGAPPAATEHHALAHHTPAEVVVHLPPLGSAEDVRRFVDTFTCCARSDGYVFEVLLR
jgi:hypothetical protein